MAQKSKAKGAWLPRYGFNTVNFLIMTGVAVATLYPFLNVLALSFNDAMDAVRGGITIFPREFTLANYQEVFKSDSIPIGFRNSVLRTAIGTVITVFSCSMVAYTFSRKDFKARKLFSIIFVVTMYVHGGLIPVYLLFRALGLFNSFLVYIIPYVIGVWNVFVIRSYMDNLPYSLQESARLDGANDLVIFVRIILPLSVPVIAAISLFVSVFQWNQWFDNYLYNGREVSLTTLQYELRKVLSYADIRFSEFAEATDIAERMARVTVTPRAMRMAMTMVATAPILAVYPFIQRYFVKGLTIGAVKN
jgi:putative aldouronate transport system permease protein